MAIATAILDYNDGNVQLEALYAFDDSISSPRPAVLINHTWVGRDSFVADKARRIAELGYVGCAIDMYGRGVLSSSPEQSARLMQPFIDDRNMLQQRMYAALTAVRRLSIVDYHRCAAIGFCFGGLCVLDLARTGADLKGVVSFHGLLDPPGNTTGIQIKAKVLALHGNDDPMASIEKVIAFEKEMTACGADWQLHVYGNTMHAFTNPNANNPAFGTVFQEDANRRSWQAMQIFLNEIFA